MLQQMSRRAWMGELSQTISPVVMAAVYVIGAVKEIKDGGGRVARIPL